MKKLLIVYYSWSNGNTKKIAKELQKVTGGDLARIDTKTAYKDQDYQVVVDQAEKDVQRGYEPVLAPRFFKVKDYDAIALGTPTWWYTMAPAMKTFLHEEKMEGKLVIPFATHGGWPAHVLDDLKTACPGAQFGPELAVQFDSQGGSTQVTPQKQVEAWLEQVKTFLA